MSKSSLGNEEKELQAEGAACIQSQKHKQCPVVREMEKSTNSIWRKMGRRHGEQARLESRRV